MDNEKINQKIKDLERNLNDAKNIRDEMKETYNNLSEENKKGFLHNVEHAESIIINMEETISRVKKLAIFINKLEQ